MRPAKISILLSALLLTGLSFANADAGKQATPAKAQNAVADAAGDDGREPIALTASERSHMLQGMRTYLEALQGITESLAANKPDGVRDYAKRAGAEMLQGTPLSVPLKAPIAFTAMSLNTHEKFDVLAGRAAKSASRAEVLTALADIMTNCTSGHAAYRVVPAP